MLGLAWSSDLPADYPRVVLPCLAKRGCRDELIAAPGRFACLATHMLHGLALCSYLMEPPANLAAALPGSSSMTLAAQTRSGSSRSGE